MAKITPVLGSLVLWAGGAWAGPPQLASVFGDHMVLQREAPVRLFGTAEPGTSFDVSIDRASRKVEADADGNWSALFDPLQAAGVHEIRLTAGEETYQTASDVLSGDVFLCSGQSNMEWPLKSSLYGEREVAAAGNDRIRLLDVSHVARLEPQAALPEGNAWAVATPESAADFSAVCFLTGKALQAEYDVPVGLIDASWGGSRIEPWISEATLDASGQHAAAVEMMRLYRTDPPAALTLYADQWTGWWKAHDWYDGRDPWTGDATLDWAPTPDWKLSDWSTWGVPELEGFLGQVWHRVTFTLTPEQAAGDAKISIGQADDVDVSWLNGTAIGATHGWGFGRMYDVPAGVLKPGENTLVVNVYNSYGGGGLTGPDEDLFVGLADGSRLPIDHGWTWLKVPGDAGNPMPAPWYPIQGYSMLHNAMIAPLAGLKLKGALWYQGESNAGEGEAYEALLGLMAEDWRGLFETPDLPVGVVQLPRWGALPVQAGQTGWGTIREAMRRAAAADDRMGLIVAIDLGDPYNLHPPEKQHVAGRAVRVMQALAYGEAITGPSGPDLAGAIRDGDVIRVDFNGIEAGLKTISGDTVIGLETCSADACRYVTGMIVGGQVVIGLPSGIAVDELRYCQGDSPLCNLFDGNGLPAGPFRVPIASKD
jgi:sialate O-acetylesterase